jgi:NADPH:quinone reductase-like Zn-dependent oxidoreductase
VRELTGGRGADLIHDPIGGKGFGRNFDMLAPLGMVVSHGRLDGPPDADLDFGTATMSGPLEGAAAQVRSGLSPGGRWIRTSSTRAPCDGTEPRICCCLPP